MIHYAQSIVTKIMIYARFTAAAFKTYGFNWPRNVIENTSTCRKAQQNLEDYRKVFRWRRCMKVLTSLFCLDSFIKYKEPEVKGVCETPMLQTI